MQYLLIIFIIISSCINFKRFSSKFLNSWAVEMEWNCKCFNSWDQVKQDKLLQLSVSFWNSSLTMWSKLSMVHFSFVWTIEIRWLERAVYCFHRETAGAVWRSKMAATQQYKAKVLFLHLAQKRMFIKEAVWFRKGYRLDSDRAAGEWAQLCRQLVCVGSSAGN